MKNKNIERTKQFRLALNDKEEQLLKSEYKKYVKAYIDANDDLTAVMTCAEYTRYMFVNALYDLDPINRPETYV